MLAFRADYLHPLLDRGASWQSIRKLTCGCHECEEEVEAEESEFGCGLRFGEVVEEAQVGEEGEGKEGRGDALGVYGRSPGVDPGRDKVNEHTPF